MLFPSTFPSISIIYIIYYLYDIFILCYIFISFIRDPWIPHVPRSSTIPGRNALTSAAFAAGAAASAAAGGAAESAAAAAGEAAIKAGGTGTGIPKIVGLQWKILLK